VVKCVIDCVHRISLLTKKIPTTDMVPSILADMVNDDSAYDMVGWFVPCLGLVWCKWLIVLSMKDSSYYQVMILTCIMFGRKVAHNT